MFVFLCVAEAGAVTFQFVSTWLIEKIAKQKPRDAVLMYRWSSA
jgi:hypothetical protein